MALKYSKRPAVSTWQTPQEIIGDRMATLKLHYKIATSGTGDWPENELKKNFDEKMRVEIAALYKELRDNGYYPDGINGLGEINFRTAFEDPVHRLLLDTVEPTPKNGKEISAMISRARESFRAIMRAEKLEIGPTQAETAF